MKVNLVIKSTAISHSTLINISKIFVCLLFNMSITLHLQQSSYFLDPSCMDKARKPSETRVDKICHLLPRSGIFSSHIEELVV